jgi:hypothetical protein
MIITFTKIKSLTIVNIQSAIGGQGKTIDFHHELQLIDIYKNFFEVYWKIASK